MLLNLYNYHCVLITFTMRLNPCPVSISSAHSLSVIAHNAVEEAITPVGCNTRVYSSIGV